jgi:quercetin dioxygenase-like cupin family protein
MTKTTTMGFACLALLSVVIGGAARAQETSALIERVVALDNDSVRIVLMTYHPGADSDLHLNLEPEITIVERGELALYTPKGREALGPGAAHYLPVSTTHLARNESAQPVKFWTLLLKRCD